MVVVVEFLKQAMVLVVVELVELVLDLVLEVVEAAEVKVMPQS